MFKLFAFFALCSLLVGCAAPKKPPLFNSQPPTFLMPKFSIIHATAAERLERAKFECEKLSEIYVVEVTYKDTHDRADSFLCVVKPQKNATSLELRVLQSRLFKTTSLNLVKAINTFMKDNNAICGTKHQIGIGNAMIFGVGGTRLKENEIECRDKNKHYMIELDQSTDSTIVRVRIYVYSAIYPEVQLTDPKEYSKFFKHIADQLFIEAIQLDPVEMR